MSDSNTIRILLVDDSKVVRMVVAKQIEKVGFVTDMADDGEKAIASVRNTAYDLIFMDVMMPNIDGLEATRQIRIVEKELGRKPAIIVGVTGYTNRTECLEAGMNDFMFKPVTIDQLKSSIGKFYPNITLTDDKQAHNLFAEETQSAEAIEATARRIEDLKRKLGFQGPKS